MTAYLSFVERRCIQSSVMPHLEFAFKYEYNFNRKWI